MRKFFTALCFVVAVLFIAFSNINANSLSSGNNTFKTEPKPVKNIPPPVLKAYQDLLHEIADEQGFSVADITAPTISWTKEANEYQVTLHFVAGKCESGADVRHWVVARFKANGDIVLLNDLGTLKRYLYSVTDCIRIGF